MLLACGGGGTSEPPPVYPIAPEEPSGPAHARGSESASVNVGSAGGTLELSNGARLEISEGALDQSTSVVFALGARTRAFDQNENQRTIGPMLVVQPSLVAGPDGRFIVSIPFTSIPDGFTERDLAVAVEVVAEEQRALEMGGVQTRWQNQAASRSGNRLTAELRQLDGLRLQFLVSR